MVDLGLVQSLAVAFVVVLVIFAIAVTLVRLR